MTTEVTPGNVPLSDQLGPLCAQLRGGLTMSMFASEADLYAARSKAMRDAADLLEVLALQSDSLRDALRKVMDATNAEAKARMSWQNARENFSSDGYEAKQHEHAMLAASDAEREARVLLLTLKA